MSAPVSSIVSPWAPRRAQPSPTENALADQAHRFGPLLAQVLWTRGFEDLEQVEELLNPKLDKLSSPFLLKNMREAAELVASAIEHEAPLAIYGDYDMDGMSGVAILKTFFEACGKLNAIAYQPDRLSEGYGVHPAALEQLAQQGVKTFITVDTGTNATSAGLKAQELGMKMIVTDHHIQSEDMPAGALIVNPNQPGETSGMGYLSGAGVAFYLAIATRSVLRERGWFEKKKIAEPDLRQWLDLFTLGTVADIVELKGDNRILLTHGLKALLKSNRPGLKQLVDKAYPYAVQLSVRDVGFGITPKLNAASRMGQPELAMKLLLTNDTIDAAQVVNEIFEINAKRSQVQKDIFDEAVEQAEKQIQEHAAPILIVRGPWFEGVLGVVAAKLVETFGRPSIVLGEVEHGDSGAFLRGSMRTTANFSCLRSLESARDLLTQFGGHRMAAGLKLAQSNFEKFQQTLWSAARDFLTTGEELSEPVLFDGEWPSRIAVSHVELLDGLAPWGPGNPQPLFLMKHFEIARFDRLKDLHVKAQLADGSELIGFFKFAAIEAIRLTERRFVDILVAAEINRFRSSKKVQLRLEHVRPSQTESFGS